MNPRPLSLATTALLIALAFVAAGAGAESISSRPFEPRSERPPESTTLFTRLGPEITRLGYVHELALWHPLKRLYHSSFACGSAHIGDVDLDGKPDIFVTGGPGTNRLYLQAEGLVFVDVTAGLDLTGKNTWAAGAALIDIDDDGDLDIYVACYDAPNQLYLNQIKETGELAFREDAARFKLAIADASLQPAFADYDRDGDLDLYLVTHQLHRPGGRPSEPIKLKQNGSELEITGDFARYYRLANEPDASGTWRYRDQGRPDRLLRNDGGLFADATTQAGISEDPAIGNSATWWDFDADGDLDLYVANGEFDPDRLFRNEGDGTFQDVSNSRLGMTSLHTTGTALIDANSDGRLDLFTCDRLATTHYRRMATSVLRPAERKRSISESAPTQLLRNALHLAASHSRLNEVAHLAEVAASDWSWSAQAADFDHDGFQDLFITTGAARNFSHADLPEETHERLVGKSRWDLYESSAPSRPEPNHAFRAMPGLGFTQAGRDWGLDVPGMAYTSATGDLDGDGDLDLVVCSLNQAIQIFRNDRQSGNAITVRLRGQRNNRNGIGAQLFVSVGSGQPERVRQIELGSGFQNGSEPVAHFGLGNATRIDSLRVVWPDGNTQSFENLETNRHYTIAETRRQVVQPRVLSRPAWFVADDALDQFPGEELVHDDFESSPLQPYRLSRRGPSQAWGDLDGDGALDFYLGGPVGQEGRILYNKTERDSSPRFSAWSQRAFLNYANAEDGPALLFDADGDSDLDLYAASGGVEHEHGSVTFRDRLFLNLRQGRMQDSTFNLPNLRHDTSCVAAADFDRDGDLDLFVGSRASTLGFPEPAPSYVLLNDGEGKFTDETATVAPGLEEAGLVTSAAWTDLDGDGWVDLVLARDWDSIAVWLNAQGTLVPATNTGLDQWSGLWRGLVPTDLDNDGDMDFVAGNWGRNTPYRASPSEPTVLFHGVFGASDDRKIAFEAYYDDGICLPLRDFHLMSAAVPELRTRIPTHHDFASASVPELFPIDQLRAARILKVTELRSGAFLNDGSARFRFIPFPKAAQMAPVSGVAASDFDGDGVIDLVLAQNFEHTHPATDPLTGGQSMILRGRMIDGLGSGRFDPVPADESGLMLTAEARGVAAVDVNLDSLPDLVISVNDDHPRLFLNRLERPAPPLRLRLRGIGDNHAAVGARVTVRVPGMPPQTRENLSPCSHLASAPSSMTFARPERPSARIEIDVRWPDGTRTTRRIDGSNQFFTVPQLQPSPPTGPEDL